MDAPLRSHTILFLLIFSILIIVAANEGDGLDGVPTQHPRRSFPKWLKRKDRKLLQTPAPTIQADIVVAKDGNGTYTTIAEAIEKAPKYSSRRIIIYVKAGRYEERNLKIGRKKRNIMLVGDGKGKTVITGRINAADYHIGPLYTASFAANGDGFIARDMTFENYAGPYKRQAVAIGNESLDYDHRIVFINLAKFH